MTGWGEGRVFVLDTETTGVDMERDRIVTACAAIMDRDGPPHWKHWLIAVDVDIPEAATEVHGVTTERARAQGVPAEVGVKEIAGAVQYAVRTGLPIVAYNAPFDLTLLDREMRRTGLGGLADWCGTPVGPVIDPLCIDKAVDRYRPGKRTLTTTCKLYGVDHGDAHDATADAVAAGRLAYRIWDRTLLPADDLIRLYYDRRYPHEMVRPWHALGRMTARELHAAQVGWYGQQAESFRQYLRREAEQKRAEAGRAGPGSEAAAVAGQEYRELVARVDTVRDEWPIHQPVGR